MYEKGTLADADEDGRTVSLPQPPRRLSSYKIATQKEEWACLILQTCASLRTCDLPALDLPTVPKPLKVIAKQPKKGHQQSKIFCFFCVRTCTHSIRACIQRSCVAEYLHALFAQVIAHIRTRTDGTSHSPSADASVRPSYSGGQASAYLEAHAALAEIYRTNKVGQRICGEKRTL